MPPCVFCQIAGGAAASRVLDEPEVCAFLDRSPLFKGHTLVVPRAHYDTLYELGDVTPLFHAVQRVARAVEEGLGAGGTFIAVNNKVSQSVPHLHVHVVPRAKGDGLRGFFWPRARYQSPAEQDEYASRIAAALRKSEVSSA
jgi:histidine triad (HIT) family protein